MWPHWDWQELVALFYFLATILISQADQSVSTITNPARPFLQGESVVVTVIIDIIIPSPHLTFTPLHSTGCLTELI